MLVALLAEQKVENLAEKMVEMSAVEMELKLDWKLAAVLVLTTVGLRVEKKGRKWVD